MKTSLNNCAMSSPQFAFELNAVAFPFHSIQFISLRIHSLSFRFEKNRRILPREAEQPQRCALRTPRALLPTSYASHACPEISSEHGLADSKLLSDPADLNGLERFRSCHETRNPQIPSSAASIRGYVPNSFLQFSKQCILHNSSRCSLNHFFCAAVKLSCSFLLKIINKRIWPSCSM
jgi:hypothetical protein